MQPTLVADESCRELPWDSAFWGYPVARLNATTLTPERLEQTLAWCRDRAVRCLFFAACGTCSTTLELAARGGFRFVDVRIDLERCIERATDRGHRDPAAVRAATAADRDGLCRLARIAHRDTRFFKDSSFQRSRAEELYAAWITRDLESHAVLVWEDAGEPRGLAGYVSCQPEPDPAAGRIGLIAVDPALRGRGIGRGLLAAAAGHFAGAGVSRMAVATQATNVSALRLYEQAGFRATTALVWFHRWFS
jgi:dTDP-4-amino-4,6-dideoxy-D-galactose acyltransferase